MTWSLRKRFLLISAGVGAVALSAAGTILYMIYEHDLRERVHAEIHHNLMQLIDGLAVDAKGRVAAPPVMSDPRFRQPASGLYWEVDTPDGQSLTSRSLWDANLKKVALGWKNIEEPATVDGPFEEPILLHSRIINLGEGPAQQQIRVMVGIDESEISEPSRRFAFRLALSLAILALAMLLVSAAQLGVVMAPINRLRQAVRSIRDGAYSRVPGGYPVEMELIVSKLNELLEQKEQSVEHARARASNFAHSLKTPLTIIDTLVPDITDQGLGDIAADINRQTGRIRQHVERELARARLASGHSVPLPDVAAVVHEVTNTVRQLPRGSQITFDIEVPPRLILHMDREDFIELIGNLLDNARKWARSRTVIRFDRSGAELRLSVNDDGPGVPDGYLDLIGQRGRRMDESTEGTGFGLAIVKDILDAYRLQIHFARSALGGLEVVITFPRG